MYCIWWQTFCTIFQFLTYAIPFGVFLVWDRVSLCHSHWPWAHYIGRDSFKVSVILLPQPPQGSDNKHVSPCLACNTIYYHCSSSFKIHKTVIWWLIGLIPFLLHRKNKFCTDVTFKNKCLQRNAIQSWTA